MVAFIDAERETYGVEPMGAVLPIAPATYVRHKAWQAYPDQRCPRAQRDAWLTTQIQRVWDANFGVYGPRKVWQQLIPCQGRNKIRPDGGGKPDHLAAGSCV